MEYRHFGPRTLRTQDTSDLGQFGPRTLRHQCRSVLRRRNDKNNINDDDDRAALSLGGELQSLELTTSGCSAEVS